MIRKKTVKHKYDLSFSAFFLNELPPLVSHVNIRVFFPLCFLSLPEATDETLLDRLNQQHRDNPLFVPSPKTKPTFTIQHFAGSVEYHIKVEYYSNTTNTHTFCGMNYYVSNKPPICHCPAKDC